MEPLAFQPDATIGQPAPAVAAAVASRPATSLAVLFQNEENALLRYTLSLVRRRSVAEDLVQEAFLRLHQVWGQVENPRAWLYRTLRNLALNHLRDHRGEAELPAEPGPSDEAHPDEKLRQDEAVGTMRLLLAELPPEDRELIQLKYHHELKYQEISRRTGLSASNVGYRLHHLLKGLADGLRRAGIDGSRG